MGISIMSLLTKSLLSYEPGARLVALKLTERVAGVRFISTFSVAQGTSRSNAAVKEMGRWLVILLRNMLMGSLSVPLISVAKDSDETVAGYNDFIFTIAIYIATGCTDK